MKTKLKHLLLPILLFFSICSFAQLSPQQIAQVDSLKKVINFANNDTIIINAWNAWDNIIYAIDPELDLDLNKKIDSLCNINIKKQLNKKEKISFLKYQGMALNNIGIFYHSQGDYFKAITFYNKSLLIREKLGDKNGTASCLGNLGIIYFDKGDYAQAVNYCIRCLNIQKELDNKTGIAQTLNVIGNIYLNQGDYANAISYHTQSMKMQEAMDNKQGFAMSLNNIGLIYVKQGDYDKALGNYKKSLKISEELGDKPNVSISLNNISEIFSEQHDYDKAMEYLVKSLKIDEELGHKDKVAQTLSNIGSVYKDQGDYTKAMDYYNKSLKIQEEIGDKSGTANTLNNIGRIYFYQGNYIKSLDYSSRSLTMAKEINADPIINRATEILWKTYKALNRYKEALSMHELFITTRDSLESVKNQKEIIKHEYKYTYEKKAAADSVAFAKEKEITYIQLEKQNLEIKAKRNQQFALFGGLFLIALFAFFMYNRFKVTSKQKGVIEIAHKELGEKNKEILDSINYAKRIQSAILPPQKLVKEFLQESFILYKPKDIVAGDFYWLDHKDGKVLFAAADCTGHGVPGAMVSVVCNNGLNRSVREHGLTDPGEILNKTREIVISEFEKSEDEVKDGMDIALCSLEGNKLQYAGAHNPLWIIRNGELLETKANKQPIGKFDNPEPYTTHSLDLERGDSLYIFSDGYVDQFGGEKGKKFKAKAFRELLLSIQDKSMEEQKQIIDDAFEAWKGSLEQIDDVCMIGVRV